VSRIKLPVPSLSGHEPDAAADASPMSSPEPTPPLVAPATSLAVQELLGFDPRLIVQLPLATTALCSRHDGHGVLVITTSKAVYAASRAAQRPVFAGGELVAMALAAEHDRAWPSTVAAWSARKADDATWRLSAQEALAGLDLAQSMGWCLGRVLRRLGLVLQWVGCGDELPEGLGA